MYIVSEEELIKIASDVIHNEQKEYHYSYFDYIKDFLKSKPQVQEIASGKLEYYPLKGIIDESEYAILKVGNASYNGIIREIIEDKYIGKHIKIFIQVQEVK